MNVTVKLPKMGDTVDNVVIEAWHVAPGDKVGAGDPLVEVETNKATVDVPSPIAGTILELLVGAGAEINTGEAICTLAAD